MKNMFRGGALLAAICFVFALTAKADDIHLCARVGLRHGQRDCDFLGNNERDTKRRKPRADWATAVFDSSDAVNRHIGELERQQDDLVVAARTAGGLRQELHNPTLNSAISQESGSGTGISALSFNVTDIPEGAWLFSGEHTSLPSEPTGTIFMAFTEDANGNLSSVTPWSSSLIATPEPSSLFLVGSAVLAGLLVSLMKAKA